MIFKHLLGFSFWHSVEPYQITKRVTAVLEKNLVPPEIAKPWLTLRGSSRVWWVSSPVAHQNVEKAKSWSTVAYCSYVQGNSKSKFILPCLRYFSSVKQILHKGTNQTSEDSVKLGLWRIQFPEPQLQVKCQDERYCMSSTFCFTADSVDALLVNTYQLLT